MPPSKPTLPKNWPTNLPYLTKQLYSTSLAATQQTALHTQPTSPTLIIPQNTPKGPSNLVKITPITTPTHPANGQSGLFTLKSLKPGSFIIQYIGEIHPSTSDPNDPHMSSNYDLSLDRELGIGIDAAMGGNEARFINDYRGVRDRPNAEFVECWDERSKERGVAVRALEGKGREKGIAKGEEILVSYGRGFWGARRDDGED